jgi:hypothetical protein
MANVSSVLFDVRNNGGGYIDMADLLPQLFVVDVKTTSSRALMSPINSNIFLNSTGFVTSNWTDGYRASNPKQVYTNLVKFTSDSEANQLGQAFTKPVGVLHNANCYSSCDMFASNMQNNAAAIIFGEDNTSGGGGANVQEYASFFSPANPIDFPPMPYSKHALLRQDARIGWRQTIRNGSKYNGKLIEDIGVQAEYTFRPSIADILPSSTFSSQYDSIADVLNPLNSNKAFVQPIKEPSGEVTVGSTLSFIYAVRGVNQLVAFDVKSGSMLGSPVIVRDTVTISAQTITFLPTINDPSTAVFEIRGLDITNKIVYRTTKSIKFLPKSLMLSSEPVNVDFTQPYIIIQNGQSSNKAVGWELSQQGMKIGDGTQYPNYLYSTALIYASVDTSKSIRKSPVQVTMNLTATYDTEEETDFFYIGIQDSQGIQLFNANQFGFQGFSGQGSTLTSDFFRWTVQDSNFQMYFLFSSDGAFSASGITISSISLSAFL